MTNAYLKEVGERVRSARMAKHLSQADLSEKLEVTPTYISNLEQGKNKMSILVLVKIWKHWIFPLTGFFGQIRLHRHLFPTRKYPICWKTVMPMNGRC